MRHLMSLCLALSVALFTGCGKDEKSGEKSGDKTGSGGDNWDSLTKEQLDAMNEMADAQDKQDNEGIAKATKKLTDIGERTKKLMKDKKPEEVQAEQMAAMMKYKDEFDKLAKRMGGGKIGEKEKK